MIKVILCDDHALIRRGIRDTLADADDIDVVSSFSACSTSRPLRPGRLMSSTSTSAVFSRISARSSP